MGGSGDKRSGRKSIQHASQVVQQWQTRAAEQYQDDCLRCNEAEERKRIILLPRCSAYVPAVSEKKGDRKCATFVLRVQAKNRSTHEELLKLGNVHRTAHKIDAGPVVVRDRQGG